ncbi:MAG: DUF998 domain-containing protein [Actinomycetota bacterium]|nr:DUF998 domain-containing protein [Actinomycetota bacterium]
MRVLALLGIFGQAFFVVVVALLPFFQPDYSSVDDAISRLLLGPYGFVLSGALFASGLGSLALAVGIRRTTRGTRGSLLGSVLIGLWGVGFALAGVVFTDAEGNPTETARTFHSAATLGFVSALAGMLLLSRVFARDALWSSFYPLSLALAFGALVGLIDALVVLAGLTSLIEAVGPAARSFEGLGMIQRVFVGTVILWMLLAAIRLRSIAKSGRFTTPSG